jgi:hypothetical protein
MPLFRIAGIFFASALTARRAKNTPTTRFYTELGLKP